MNTTTLRYLAAAGAGLVAVAYLLIGFNVITVIDDQGPGLGTPLLVAAGLFAALAVLVAVSARRAVVFAGASLQLLVIAGYLVISAERTPAFEAWGLGVKALQAALLAAFVYLGFQRLQSDVGTQRRDDAVRPA